jgi:hypothetical protein
METGRGGTHRLLARGYAASYLVSVTLIAVLFVALDSWDADRWTGPLSREETFAAGSVAIATAIGLFVIINRKRFDPIGLIFNLPEQKPTSDIRRAAKFYALLNLSIVIILGWILTTFLPPCEMPGCIEFTDESLVLDFVRSVVPVLIIIVLGNCAGSFVGYVTSYLRTRNSI